MLLRRGAMGAAVAAALWLASAAGAHEIDGGAGGGARLGPGTPTLTTTSGANPGSAVGMEAVGRHALGGRGFNADVWVHDRHAYVGSWGFSDWAASGDQRFCPDQDRGVIVVDARNPADPQRVATLRNPAGTSAEDVVVYEARYGAAARRDIAVVGIQVCGGSRYDTTFQRGLQVWDVTNPAAPVELALLNTGCCTRGLHELEVQHRTDLRRTFVYASVPASEYPDSASPTGRRDQRGRGDMRLIDVTDPSRPVEISDWGVHKDAGGPLNPGQGCDPDPEYGHSIEPSADGKTAFIAYWDSGYVAIDVGDPAQPRLLGHTRYGLDEDGDAHSSNFDEGRKLLFSADEDFGKTCGTGIEKGFGYLRVWDYADPANPTQIGEYRTPNSSGAKDVKAGDYTIHNPLLVGSTLFVSWYTDGIRVLDVSNPRAPREVASFVPPSETNPVKPSQRGVLTNTTQVWGVAYEADRGLVFASDMNSGLWILRRTGG